MRCMGIYCMVSMTSFVGGQIPTLQQSLPLMMLRATLIDDTTGNDAARLEAVQALCNLAVSR